MANIALSEFIDTNLTQLIHRCRLKVIERSGPAPANHDIQNGVPQFLNQLVQELRNGPSNSREINKTAIKHGKELLREGYTIGQVVHEYGDVCQSVTDLAVELAAPVSAEDFRTLNRCLDDAIAGAVSEYSRDEDLTRDGESHELRILLRTAITGFEALQMGSVPFKGTTAALVHSSLLKLLAGMDRAMLEPVRSESKNRPTTV